jgi:hypothetical protein
MCFTEWCAANKCMRIAALPAAINTCAVLARCQIICRMRPLQLSSGDRNIGTKAAIDTRATAGVLRSFCERLQVSSAA